MAKIKVVMNSRGSAELMNSLEMQEDLLRRAERIKVHADSMGSGRYEADVQPGKTRAHAMVKTPYNDLKTLYSQRKHNTLLKSMDAGRD